MASNLPFRYLPNSFILSIAFPKSPTIPSIALPNKLVSFIYFAIPLTKLPRDPVMLKMTPLKLVILLIRSAIALAAVLTITTPTFRTENIPSKVDFILPALLLVHSLKDPVKSRIPLVILISCSDVAGGNILRNASLIGLIIFINPSNAFFIASIPAARPPFSAHSPTTLFLASADFPIISLSVSETLVQSFLASSKSPTIYSHV